MECEVCGGATVHPTMMMTPMKQVGEDEVAKEEEGDGEELTRARRAGPGSQSTHPPASGVWLDDYDPNVSLRVSSM